jgi:hypothetical protein
MLHNANLDFSVLSVLLFYFFILLIFLFCLLSANYNLYFILLFIRFGQVFGKNKLKNEQENGQKRRFGFGCNKKFLLNLNF